MEVVLEMSFLVLLERHSYRDGIIVLLEFVFESLSEIENMQGGEVNQRSLFI